MITSYRLARVEKKKKNFILILFLINSCGIKLIFFLCYLSTKLSKIIPTKDELWKKEKRRRNWKKESNYQKIKLRERYKLCIIYMAHSSYNILIENFPYMKPCIIYSSKEKLIRYKLDYLKLDSTGTVNTWN